MERKITLKDLSHLLGLSISTISKALHDSPEISKKTKIKVKKAAESYEYSPNLLARSLKQNKTKTIGVIVPDVLNHFFAKAIHGVETTASKLGYKVLICLSNESIKKEAESLQTMINGNVDGVILSLSRETQTMDKYTHFEGAVKYDLPIVLFDRTTSRLFCDKISINDKLAAWEATNYMIASGCDKIIFLSTIQGTSVGERRKLGYIKAMEEAGMKDFSLTITDYLSFDKIIMDVLRNRNIDGVLAADELSAISVIKCALKNNYRIPQELSVIGFTNGLLGEAFVPSLTTVDQHAEEQGALAAETLINRIEKKLPAKSVQKILPTSIIQRESTRSTVRKILN